MRDLGPLAEMIEAHDPVRFSSALLAPAERRRGLLALLALNVELARISAMAHEALIAEIRLAWWREALAGLAQGHTRGHPVLSELLMLVEAGTIQGAELESLASARQFDISTDTMADEAAFADYAHDGARGLARLSIRHLGAELPDDFVQTAARAGLRINHLAGLWGNLARGKVFLGAAPILPVADAAAILAERPPHNQARDWFADQIARADNELNQVKAAWRREWRGALPVFASLRLSRKVLAQIRRDPFRVHPQPGPGARARMVVMAALTGRPL